MNTRVFNYGVLSVTLFESPKYGWVTTMAELAKGCGVDKASLTRACQKYQLVRKGSVVEDTATGELVAKLQPIQRGPRPTLFWTVEGMTFVAMFLRTTQYDCP